MRNLCRQYGITSDADFINVSNGRCPEYALTWDYDTNSLYWPKGHDYYLGNNLDINDNKELREILSNKIMYLVDLSYSIYI